MARKRAFLTTLFVVLYLVLLMLPLMASPANNQKNPADAALLAQNALNSTSLRSDDSQHPVPAGAGSEPASAADSAFSLEKLVIALGLFLVIILVIFKWGTSPRQKKQTP